MILAAGLGTRLRPLTLELPKPLIPVGDRPAIAHIAEALARAGFDRAVVNVHHLAEAFTSEVLGRLPLALSVAHEPEILGTAGGVANAADLLGEGDVMVWNGDILADLDVAALYAAHRASNASAVLAVAPRADDKGTLGLGADGRVVRLRGERYGEEVASADFLGIQVIGAELRRSLPAPGCLVEHGYQPALRRGERLATFASPGAWDDIGSIASYLAANRRWLERRGLTSFVHPGARVAEGVALRRAVVGEGAVVTGHGLLEDAVIWPRARAVAPLAHAVIVQPAVIVH